MNNNDRLIAVHVVRLEVLAFVMAVTLIAFTLPFPGLSACINGTEAAWGVSYDAPLIHLQKSYQR